jgi:hypothetical protein
MRRIGQFERIRRRFWVLRWLSATPGHLGPGLGREM